MERLTKWNEQTEQAELLSWDEKEWKDFMGSLDVPIATELSIAINKIAEYEDLEEHVLLLGLPVSIGGTVYQNMIVGLDELKKPIYKIYEAKVIKYVLDSNTLCFWTETKDNFKYRNEMPLSALGKTVFLTREEAEAALAEMNERNNINE